MKKFICVVIALFSIVLSPDLALAGAPLVTLDLWPGTPPGQMAKLGPEKTNPTNGMLTNISTPTITVYRPDKGNDTGTTILVCPGGGFTSLSMENEGTKFITWLNSVGITGVLLKYRVPYQQGTPRYLAGMQDGQRAMSLVRSKAAEWKIDPNRIGILGFSAGGEVAVDVSTNFDKLSYDAIDEIDKTSSRPDFALAIYPGGLRPKGSTDGSLSPDVHPSKDTPTTFICVAHDDRYGAEDAVYYYLALKRAGVNTELHVYSEGGHGFGMHASTAPHGTWTARAWDWMNYHKFLQPTDATTRPQ
ncbi:MAG: alpha/beta hydrolase [Planctomycetota bacterium]|nr:alpha/beta hydrolase [Planctomycetota bacterium]